MAKLNINNIENVEGKYHLMFYEGKKMVETAKNDLRFVWFSLLVFFAMVLIFILLTTLNMYYIGFFGVFFLFFMIMLFYLSREKRRGRKQCIYAVQNSKTSDIVCKQVDNRGRSKAIVSSMSTTIDKYDSKKKFGGIVRKYKRRRKHSHIVGAIMEFEKEEKKEKTE